MLLSAPVVPAVAELELPMLDDELDEPLNDTLVSMYFAALLALELGFVPVVPVVALWLDGSTQPVTVTELEFDFSDCDGEPYCWAASPTDIAAASTVPKRI